MATTLPALTLLHGARANAEQLATLAGALEKHCNAFLPNLIGHGGRAIPDRFTIETLAEDLLAQLDEQGINATFLFGYSIGGYVALHLARHHPERVLGVVTLATKVVFDQATVDFWTHLSGVQRIRETQADEMNRRHPGQNWDRLVSGLAEMYRALGRRAPLTELDFSHIGVPVLVISASNDQLVPWAEALRLANLIPGAQGFTFAGKAHPLNVIPPQFLATVIGTWLVSRAEQSQAGGGGRPA